jgi:hypothetical protein
MRGLYALSVSTAAVMALVFAGSAFASHPRPAGATPTRVALVPALEQCTTPNARHGPPLDRPSCGPPVQTSDYVTVGTLDANGAPPNSNGFVRLDVFFCPQCASPINEDLFITTRITDVRRLDNLEDYLGELEGKLTLRLTDHFNATETCTGTYSCAATVVDVELPHVVPCTATSAGDVGSTCEVQTSANALLPGIVRMGLRATWELDQVQVFDGGADGQAETPGNTLFAVQGVFLP